MDRWCYGQDDENRVSGRPALCGGICYGLDNPLHLRVGSLGNVESEVQNGSIDN